jgi:hypothetical protein
MSKKKEDELDHIPQLALRLRILEQAEKRIYTILSEAGDGKESEAGNESDPLAPEPDNHD